MSQLVENISHKLNVLME